MNINGLPLPRLLIELIASNRWKVPADANAQRWQQFLNHWVGFDGPYPQVRFFQPTEMADKTAMLSQESYYVKLDPRVSGTVSRLRPEAILAVDPVKSIVIADLLFRPMQPEHLTTPVVLDYRQSCNDPCVIYFPDDPFESYWCEIAPNFNALAQGLGI